MYDLHLADRISYQLKQKGIVFEEKKMMGGLCFMVDDKMCIGINKDEMMARIGPDLYEEALQEEGCKEMRFTKRPMKGFVYIEARGIDSDADLEKWVQRCLDFNPLAKSSKK